MTRRLMLAAVAVLVLAGVAEAQDVATRFYIVPKIGDGLTFETPFRPKYITDLGVPWSAMDYGKETTMLVGAEVTGAQNTSISANLDVTAIPAALDSNLSAGAVTVVQNALENLKMPGAWVSTSSTYRQVVGNVARMCLLMQRFDGLNASTFFQSGITLDTRINQLTTNQRDKLAAAAGSLGLDVSFITGPMTVRTVLRTWVQAMGPVALHGEVF
jgi:hypothetical protein